jgi:hypothetical protein
MSHSRYTLSSYKSSARHTSKGVRALPKQIFKEGRSIAYEALLSFLPPTSALMGRLSTLKAELMATLAVELFASKLLLNPLHAQRALLKALVARQLFFPVVIMKLSLVHFTAQVDMPR